MCFWKWYNDCLETNVTDTDSVYTDIEDSFDLDFSDNTGTTQQSCVFRKYDDNP